MCPIIDVEMVVAVHLESLKLEQELFHDGLCLEGDDAVLVPLIPAVQHRPVYRALDSGEEVAVSALVADLVHLVCSGRDETRQSPIINIHPTDAIDS